MQTGRRKRLLPLPNGFPSHDTLGRLFAALDTEQLTECFVQWMASAHAHTDGDVVAIDGKTLRRSFDRTSSKAAIHMVSAFAAHNGVVLGQVKTHESPPQGDVVRLFREEGYGFIEAADGREIYFHRNSVLRAPLEQLQVGQEVRFDEEQGVKGPQATTVRVVGKHPIVG